MADERELKAYGELREVVRRLRAPEGCPWDLEQTHASLRPFVTQEAYEVVAAIDAGEIARLPDELGDLLFQVLLHAEIASQSGEWALADVFETLTEKLVRRHPHVFGPADGGPSPKLENAAQVVDQWDELKKKERAADASALRGLPEAMAALALAQETLRRAAAAGFAWPEPGDVLEKLTEEVGELAAAKTDADRAEEFGDILLNLANYARYIDIDAEEALRLATRKFRRRFEVVEATARKRDLQMKALPREQLMALWQEAKRAEA